MKTYLKTILIIALFLSVPASPLAAKMLVPDSQKLQPIPVHVYPDVSGNVNENNNSGTQNTPISETQPVSQETSSASNSKSSSGIFWPVICIVIVLLAIILFIIFY